MGFTDRTKRKNNVQSVLLPIPQSNQPQPLQKQPPKQKQPQKQKQQTPRAPRKSTKKTEMTIIIEICKKLLLDELLLDGFKQIKQYFRKGERPAQSIAIENFEKHLKEINLIDEKIKKILIASFLI